MAKLSARNRRELSRYERLEVAPEPGIMARTTTYALMSDGHILSKRAVRFDDEPRPHSLPWKDSPGYLGVGQFAEFRAQLVRRGFSLVGAHHA